MNEIINQAKALVQHQNEDAQPDEGGILMPKALSDALLFDMGRGVCAWQEVAPEVTHKFVKDGRVYVDVGVDIKEDHIKITRYNLHACWNGDRIGVAALVTYSDGTQYEYRAKLDIPQRYWNDDDLDGRCVQAMRESLNSGDVLMSARRRADGNTAYVQGVDYVLSDSPYAVISDGE